MVLRPTSDAPPYLVEIHTAHGQLTGLTRAVQGRQRLVDVLNGPDAGIDLEGVKSLASGLRAEMNGLVSVLKQFILIAVPHETQQQTRDFALQRNLMGALPRRAVRLSALLPHLAIEGIAHISGGAGAVKFETALFGQFFAMTQATVRTQEKEVCAELVVVNRDAVIAAQIEAIASQLRPL